MRRSVITPGVLVSTGTAALALLTSSLTDWPWWMRLGCVVLSLALAYVALERKSVARRLGGPIEKLVSPGHKHHTRVACFTGGLLLLAASLLWLGLGGGQWGWAGVFLALGGLLGYWGLQICPRPKDDKKDLTAPAGAAVAVGAYLLAMASNFVAGALAGQTSLDASIASITGGIRSLEAGQERIEQGQRAIQGGVDRVEHGQQTVLENQARQSEDLAALRDDNTQWEGAIRDVIREHAIDVAAIRADEFTIEIDGSMSGYSMLRIRAGDALHALAEAADLQFRVGSRPWRDIYPDSFRGGFADPLQPEDVQAGGPVRVRIVMETASRQIGHVVGPFEYPLDVAASQSRSQRRAIEAMPWFDQYGSDRQISIELLEAHGTEVAAVLVGPSPDDLSVRLELPEVPGAVESVRRGLPHDPEALADAWMQSREALAPLAAHPTLHARLEYRDGATSPVRAFRRPPTSQAAYELEDPAIADMAMLLRGEGLEGAGVGNTEVSLQRLWRVRDRVQSIQIREREGGPEIPIDLLPRGNPRLDAFWTQDNLNDSLKLPPAWQSVQVRMGFNDGRTTPWIDIELPSDQSDTRRWVALASQGPGAEQARLHVAIDPTGARGLHVWYDPPRGTTRAIRSTGDGAFEELGLGDRRHFESSPKGFEQGWHVVYQLENGSEIGPIEYDLRPVLDLARRAMLPRANTRRREMLAAGRIGEGSLALTEGYGNVGVMQLHTWRDRVPGILVSLTGDLELFAAVDQIQLGPDAQRVTHTLDSPIGPQYVLSESYAMSVRNMEAPELSVVLPADTAQVWARFLLCDGTTTQPVQVSIVNLP